MKTLLMILGITAILGAADGASLYKKCAACHGAQGEKKALGKSAAIKGTDTLADLKGYKAGTLNKAGMGALMKGQVAAYSDADLEAVAAYIKAQ
ncbi:MAG: c-type cytochrome [Campylobacterota bacterium]|nr:c-type cytochrome [Campylobacterota bacterium]